MPGSKKCAFFSCSSNTKQNKNLRFFKFPVLRPDVCERWIVNCANEHLEDLPNTALSARVVCEKHFKKRCFTSLSGNCRLAKDAIPTAFVSVHDEQSTSQCPAEHHLSAVQQHLLQRPTTSMTPNNTSHEPSTAVQPTISHQIHNNVVETPQDTSSLPLTTSIKIKRRLPTPCKIKRLQETPRKLKLRRNLLQCQKMLHSKSEKIRRNKSATTTKKDAFSTACKHIKSESFKTLLHMQMFHQERTQWTEAEKQLSIDLHYRSPSLFMNLATVKEFNLPSRRTISQWLNINDLQPGISEDLLEKLKLKVKTMDERSKNAVLMFDEMSIKKCLSYNEKRDLIEGFEDLGSLGRTTRVGTHVLMFVTRGLFDKWKMPVAYYVSGTVTDGDTLNKIINEVITALVDIGLKIRVLVCDQGKNNTKAISKLNVTQDRPFFLHNEEKVFFVYDVPHLFKSIRNNLLSHDIHFDDGIASWKYIEDIYRIDVASTKARALCKITEKHIAPNSFDKMKVKLATQIFSHSMKAALFTAVGTGQLPIQAAETAKFIDRMNDTFDCLNSRQMLDSNPNKCAVSECTEQGKGVLQKLNTALPWIKSWNKVVKKDSKRFLSRPPCFLGLELSINAVLQLWNDLSGEGFQFLLTNRLTQDAIEHEFSICRQRGGFDRNPSAMKFRQNLRHRIQIILMTAPTTSNCEVEDSEGILPLFCTKPEEDIQVISDTDVEEDNSDQFASNAQLLCNNEEVNATLEYDDSESLSDTNCKSQESCVASPEPSPRLHTLQNCSVQYLAGYLAKVCLNKFNCKQCKTDLTKADMLNDSNELLILHKSYGTKEGVSHLNAPSSNFAAVTDIVLTSFANNYPRLKHLPQLKSTLVEMAKKELSTKDCEWLECGSNCVEHRKFLLEFVIRLKLIKTVLWESREMKYPRSRNTTKSKYFQKIKNLSNM